MAMAGAVSQHLRHGDPPAASRSAVAMGVVAALYVVALAL